MKKFTVQIQTSVEVQAISAAAALEIATEWASNSLSDSNAIGKVYHASKHELGEPILTQEL